VTRRALVATVGAVLAVLLAATVAIPASAATVIEDLGRRVTFYNHFGDPAKGQVQASAQGQIVDTNGNGLADSMRGRGALLEIHGVKRLVIYSVDLQVFRDGAWRLEVQNPSDRLADSYAVQFTQPIRLCFTSDATSTYRVVHRDGIRWDDDTLGTRTTISNEYTAQMLADDPDCPATAPARSG
jgi:hypothetical protein